MIRLDRLKYTHGALNKTKDYLLNTPVSITDQKCILSSFRPVTGSDVRRIIMSSPVKSCSLDPWPTFLIRDYVDLRSSHTICEVHGQRSLSRGHLPDSHKHAIVSPLLKKAGLDTADMANFRPDV